MMASFGGACHNFCLGSPLLDGFRSCWGELGDEFGQGMGSEGKKLWVGCGNDSIFLTGRGCSG